MNVPFPIWNVNDTVDPVYTVDWLPFNVTDQCACDDNPDCANVTVYVKCVYTTEIVDGFDPATVTLPVYVPVVM